MIRGAPQPRHRRLSRGVPYLYFVSRARHTEPVKRNPLSRGWDRGVPEPCPGFDPVLGGLRLRKMLFWLPQASILWAVTSAGFGWWQTRELRAQLAEGTGRLDSAQSVFPASSSVPSSYSASPQVWWGFGHLRVTPLGWADPPGLSTSPSAAPQCDRAAPRHPVPCPSPGNPQPWESPTLPQPPSPV